MKIAEAAPALPLWRGPLDADVFGEARAAAPGWDVHYLEQEWRNWLSENDITPVRPERHYLFCASWFEKRGRLRVGNNRIGKVCKFGSLGLHLDFCCFIRDGFLKDRRPILLCLNRGSSAAVLGDHIFQSPCRCREPMIKGMLEQ